MNTLHLEIPANQRLSLDVNRLRVLTRYARIDGPLGRLEVDAIDLDTGGALALIAPSDAVEELLESGEARPGKVGTAAGEVPTRVIEVTLRLGDWILDGVELHASQAHDRWLLGMPVLRHFDLLLRDQHLGGPWLVGPAPGLIQVGGVG